MAVLRAPARRQPELATLVGVVGSVAVQVASSCGTATEGTCSGSVTVSQRPRGLGGWSLSGWWVEENPTTRGVAMSVEGCVERAVLVPKGAYVCWCVTTRHNGD